MLLQINYYKVCKQSQLAPHHDPLWTVLGLRQQSVWHQ